MPKEIKLTCDEPCGVELGKGAKNVEMERCPGVDVEFRLVVIPPALANAQEFLQLSTPRSMPDNETHRSQAPLLVHRHRRALCAVAQLN